jgi:Cof subfamily protein (haloacid dehalogenase superfamily)
LNWYAVICRSRFVRQRGKKHLSEIKLVVCDLDGTLLNDKKMITEYSIKVLQEARRQGIQICFASGRDEQMMSVYAKLIGGCDYMLSDNGALVRDGGGNMLHSAVLKEEDACRLLTYLNKREMTFMMYSAERMYFSEGSEKLKKRIRDYEDLSVRLGCPVKLQAEEYLRTAPATGYCTAAKIVAYEEDPGKVEDYIEFIGTLPRVHCESTGYGLMGAFDQEVSKKTALHKIMERMGIGGEAVCVFGDFDNDLSMFECADHRVCMANGVEKLKAAASYVTLSNNEDGVAVYLADVLGIMPK